MTNPVVGVERTARGVAVITISRPEALNALNGQVIQELGQALHRLAAEGVRQVVLTGAGEKAFVAGADIAAMASFNRAEATAFARRGQRVLNQLSLYPGVTIAAVNGFALGGGMELAMACDLILASENAKFGQPEVNLGVIPGFGGTQRLSRLIGPQRARELIFTGRTFDAQEAVSLGLALRATPRGGVVDAALEIAHTIASKGPRAIELAKLSCANGERFDLAIGLQEEAEFFGQCFETSDQSEGMSAFLEKRSPMFAGK
ncbi:MAG TPA: hypothetical protein DIU15_11380 [Deltaproteobacteria bacterium]|nr:hypothetical protein [Deltaproteobacteria bacterium]HCP46639.1 hypothetical protein [Deltaproteobacteria bacterium]|tara:strand:- start:456 stop:1238 length:783 start_codon:yes stop_codon:yes gene_type:complete